MMTKARLEAEKAVLAKKLPSNIYLFKDMDDPVRACLIVAAKTNAGKLYTMKIMLGSFPDYIPEVIITKRLVMKDGSLIPSWSHEMHTHECTENTTAICHYRNEEWSKMVSLYLVYVKCRLWLEMYDEHLKTGKCLDYYLSNND